MSKWLRKHVNSQLSNMSNVKKSNNINTHEIQKKDQLDIMRFTNNKHNIDHHI